MVQPGPSPRPSTIRVLHIDNEQSQLKFTKSFVNLSDSTIHMESISTPEAALRRLEEETFDCVVTDYKMSPMDGIELSRRIRESSDIPLILYTGRGSEEVAEAAFTVGIDDYIRKEANPSHYQVLARRIRSAVDKKRAEDKVIQERDWAQKYLDAAAVMMVILDTEGSVSLLNQKGCEILGVSQEDALGKNWFDSFLLSLNVEEVKGVFRELMEGNIEPVRFYENPVVSSSGEERIIAWNNSLLHDDEGNITGILSSGSDITEQRRTEEKFRALLEASRDAIFVLDHERYLYGNSKAAELLGLSDPSELIGRDAFEFVAPEDREKVREIAFRRQRGEVVPNRYEFNLVNLEGKRVPVEANVSLIEFDGKPASLSINRDITERKRMEDEAKQYQIRLEALHSHASRLALASTIEEVYEITLSTMAVALGFEYHSFHTLENGVLTTRGTMGGPSLVPPTPIDGRGITTMAAREARTVLINDVREEPAFVKGYLESLSELAVPVISEGKALAVLNVESEKLGAYDTNDQRLMEILADHVASAMERIQSRRRLEELHERHSRELVDGVQRVSSMVRHDLRGPLQTIMNAAYVAETNPKKTAEMMDIITKSVRHQSDIMENWKNQDLEETPNTTEEDLSQIISDALAASLIPSHIAVDVNVDPMKVSLDKVKMRRVMDNLIRNAIEAIGNGGRLTISAREDEHGIVIEVADTGIGIPESEMENLFKPFYTTKSSGIGLGLTYCRWTVEAHKGTIEVESKAGEGTKIMISMPKTPEAEQPSDQ